MEPLKIIPIGRIGDGKFTVFDTQLNQDLITFFFWHFGDNDFQSALSSASKDISFQVSTLIGEGSKQRKLKLDLIFPRLKEISESGSLVNLLQFYGNFIFDAVDLKKLNSSESDVPHSGYLQRFWCLSEDLVYVNRPCRSSEDFGYIKLRVEEFLLENKDEYAALQRKVERLRKTIDRSYSGSRKFPSDDVLAFVMKRDGERCVICSSQERLQFDHIFPKSKGGNDESENLRVLCRTCNIKRGNLSRL
jgi:hypothetical protein